MVVSLHPPPTAEEVLDAFPQGVPCQYLASALRAVRRHRSAPSALPKHPYGTHIVPFGGRNRNLGAALLRRPIVAHGFGNRQPITSHHLLAFLVVPSC